MKLLMIGCGNMGGAIVKGVLASGILNSTEIEAILPDEKSCSETSSRLGISCNLTPLHSHYSLIIWAVKPQQLDDVINKFTFKPTTMLSIIAGKNIAYFKKHHPDCEVVRAMPNLAAMVGAGATVAFSHDQLAPTTITLMQAIFKGIGTFDMVDSEELIDLGTAISGSGPAYFFMMTEYLEAAAINLGMSQELAQKLARQTLIGAAKTLEASPFSAGELRSQVTSPGGTTQAAISSFNNNQFNAIMKEAVSAAFNRARELSN